MNAHHLDKNDGLLTSHQILAIFVPKLFYFNVVCIGLFVLFVVILILLSALRPSFLHAIFDYVFRNIPFRLIELRCIIVSVYDWLIDWLIVRLIVDCGSWSITCKIKDWCKRSTLVCYSSISICEMAPKHLVNRVLERHPLESYESDFFGRRKHYTPHSFLVGILGVLGPNFNANC